MNFLYVLDLVGIFACSVAASLIAKQKGMDFSGAVTVAMVGAVGGGTVRDLLLNRGPLFWLVDLNYVILICITSLLVQIFYFYTIKYKKAIRWFDSIGLAAFSIIGFDAALSEGMHSAIVVLMGIITATAGGMARDIICREIPYVLRHEIYISASMLGGVVYLALRQTNLSLWVIQTITMLVIISFRMISVYKDWHLPSLTLPQNNQP